MRVLHVVMQEVWGEAQNHAMQYYHMPNILDNSIPIENVHCLIHFYYSDIFLYHIVQELSHTPSGQTSYSCITMVILAPQAYDKLSNL